MDQTSSPTGLKAERSDTDIRLREILCDVLGYSAEEVRALREAGAI